MSELARRIGGAVTWRGPRTAPDPALTTRSWRELRKHWQRLRLPCARCRGPIDYDGPRFLIVRGRRRLNPRYLVVGHIVSRRTARILGWSDAQTNGAANTQPECQTCSNRSGAREGQRAQRAVARVKVARSRW